MLGYACINSELSAQKITTNRTMRKKTFQDRGLPYVSKLALQNCKDLLTILRWNEQNNIKFFRLSSNLFPWWSEYNLEELPDFEQIELTLLEVGLFIIDHSHRITTHPDHFNKLASPKADVVVNTIKDLENHGKMFDLLGLSRTPYNKINIHVGATYGNKVETAKRFCDNFYLLSETVRTRLTVENDDKASLFSTQDLYGLIHKNIGVPVVFDYHHHKFCTGGQTEREALMLASTTWKDIVPVIHYSESRALEYKDDEIKPQAHSDFIVKFIDKYGLDVDVMIEAKAKEQALFKYRKLYK